MKIVFRDIEITVQKRDVAGAYAGILQLLDAGVFAGTIAGYSTSTYATYPEDNDRDPADPEAGSTEEL